MKFEYCNWTCFCRVVENTIIHYRLPLLTYVLPLIQSTVTHSGFFCIVLECHPYSSHWLKNCIPTCSRARISGQLSKWFEFNGGVWQGCSIACTPLLLPMNWLLDRTAHQGFLGVRIGSEVFTNLDYADDRVTPLAEMLEVILLALDILQQEAHPLGLQINRHKTKLQTSTDFPTF